MTRILLVILLPTAAFARSPGDLRALARSYYDWRDSIYPVFSSDQGKHTWDDRLTDYRMPAVRERRRHVDSVLARAKAMRTDGWGKDDRIDKILFEAQLEKDAFFPRVMRPEESDPQVYVNEASNGIFSLLRKEYAPKKHRAAAAASRLLAVPGMLQLARANLTQPVKLYAQLAISAARHGDDLYTTSLITLADGLDDVDRTRLVSARDGALKALHDFADWLESRQETMPDWKPMGEAQYNSLWQAGLFWHLKPGKWRTPAGAELAGYRAPGGGLRIPGSAWPIRAGPAQVPKAQ